MDENNTKGVLLLQLWADDTLLHIRRRKLLNNEPEPQDIAHGTTVEMLDTDIQRTRDHTAACLQHGEMTVTEVIIMLDNMIAYNQIATRWLLHRFASARINPILFSSGSDQTNNPHVLEDWINDLYELLDCLHSRIGCPQIVEDQFSIAMVEARLHNELEPMLDAARDKWLAMMMATDKRWGKDSPLHSLDPDLLKRYLLL